LLASTVVELFIPLKTTNARTTITPITIPMMTLRFIVYLQGLFSSDTTHPPPNGSRKPLDGGSFSKAPLALCQRLGEGFMTLVWEDGHMTKLLLMPDALIAVAAAGGGLDIDMSDRMMLPETMVKIAAAANASGKHPTITFRNMKLIMPDTAQQVAAAGGGCVVFVI